MNALPAVGLLAALGCLAGCQEKEANTGDAACPTGYDRTVFDQCVAACISVSMESPSPVRRLAG